MPGGGKSRRARAPTAATGRRVVAMAESKPPARLEEHSGAVIHWSPAPIELLAAAVPRARRLRRWLVGAVLLVAFVAPLVSWLRYEARNVTSTNAAVRGHISEIGTQLQAVVVSVEVDAGDRVTAQQLLVRLEDRQLRADAQEARAELEGFRQALEVERLAIEHERRQLAQQGQEAVANVAAAEAQVAAAEVKADDARRFHEVRQALFERGGAISGENVRDAESARRTAQALLNESRAKQLVAESSEEGVRLTSEGLAIRERKVAVLETDVRRAEARLAKAEADLASVSIRAPEDGAILSRIVQPGASVEVGQPIISMWLGRELWVDAWIDEDDLASVAVGNPATVTLRAMPGREFEGVVDKIGLATDFELPAADVPQPRFSRMRGAPVVGVRVKLREPSAELVPGLSAVVAIRRSD